MSKNATAQRVNLENLPEETSEIAGLKDWHLTEREAGRQELIGELKRLPTTELLPLSILNLNRPRIKDSNHFKLNRNANQLLKVQLESVRDRNRAFLHAFMEHQTRLYENNLKLLSLNVWGLPQLCGFGSIDHTRFEKIAALLNAGTEDIVLLQEMWDPATTKILDRAGYPFVGKATKDGFINGSGLVTLSRYPIVESEFLQFSDVSGLERLVKKGALRTRLRISSTVEIDVVNVHLASPPEKLNKLFVSNFEFERILLSQLRQTKEWLRNRSSLPELTIVGGDFNIDESHLYYAEMAEMFGLDMYRLRLGPNERAWSESKIEQTGYTLNPLLNSYAKRSQYDAERIDYFWVASLDLEDAACGSGLRFTSEPVSDHFGVELNIAWKSNLSSQIGKNGNTKNV